jgi:hypothetical protein
VARELEAETMVEVVELEQSSPQNRPQQYLVELELVAVDCGDCRKKVSSLNFPREFLGVEA